MKIRDEIGELTPYRTEDRSPEVRLDKNESPFSLPDQLKGKIRDELARISFNRYPSPDGDRLRGKLADFHGLKVDNVAVGSGSDQLISYSARLFAGDQVVTTPPTFSMYGFYARINGLKVAPVSLDQNFDLQLQEIKDNLTNPAAVFLCSPNNPTGNTFPREEIVAILDTGAPVILDEAYANFSGRTNLDLIKSYDNLLVLRTFSKAFGLAGARVGYAVGDKRIIDYLLRAKPPYNTNSISLRVAGLLLDNYDLVQERVEFIVEERERIYGNFEEICYPSRANFLLMDVDAGEYFRDKGIAVRTFSGRLADKIRVTVGKKEENDQVIETLEELTASGQPGGEKRN